MDKKVSEMLADMNKQQLRQFYDQMSLFADDLGQALIGKIGGPRTPLTVDDLPWNGFEKGETLDRLYRLEEAGVFKSEMVKKGSGYVRKFSATELGKRIAREASLPDEA